MAGESPDKTEQRKSSSGTAAEERDPRFAVFRDPGEAADEAETEGADAGTGADAGSDADAGSGTGAGSGATSDTATAVFRPRLPEDGARREPKAEVEADAKPEAVSGGEASSAAENASEAGSDAGNGREGGPEAAREPESAPEATATASEGAGEAEEPAKAPEAARGSASPEAGEKAADAEKSDAGKSDAEKSGAETADGADAADGSEAAAPAKGEADGDEPEAADGDGRLRAAVAAWVDADAEAGADADAETDEKPKPGSTSKAEKPGKAEKAEQGTSAGREKRAGQDERDGEPESAAKPVPAGRSTADSGSDKDTDADTDKDSNSDGDSAADSGGGSDLRGIDQPTAVFMAVKPGAKGTGGVDQATTALKLPRDPGTGTKPAAKPGAAQPGGKSAAEPESDAERTSTFVPLRSDDVRTPTAPRKPEAGSTAGTTGAATGTAGAANGADAGTGTPARTPEAGAPAPAAPSWAAAERTRQQPLPPKPPLDLLAELTNTPPPPETPVRTAVRRVKIWTPLVLLLLIVFAIVQVTRPLPEPSLELTAKPTYTFEGGETKLSWPGQGQSAVMVDGVGSLGTEGPQKPAPIASVAKVMTAYVILREHPLKGDEEGEKITVDQKAEDESKRPDESTAPLTKGQKLSQRQMLQLLMIPSGNNAARLLARWDAGSEDAFIDKMNDAAKDLGMKGSTYTDPSGLEKTTVSTAADQLKLAQAVMRNEVFRKIVDMPEVEIEGIDGKIYNNNNLLLQPGVSGIKTGSSTPAGGNLLWSANTKVDGKMLWIYGAVMGQQAGTGRVYDSLELSLQNSLKLIKDAQKAATSATVLKKGDVVGYVDNGFGGKTPVVATKSLKAVGWSGLEVELEVTDNGEGIDPSAKAGSEVGMVTVGTGTGKMTAPVVLQDDLAQPAFGDKLTRVG
ncbi:serine hydrolase [Streptomyces californicus]|uniref:Serine hydrolase n=1 Tax=Streptomyces californicus TaxID=67351 RepID=A0ABX7J470_9ACTN|nr:MULTISPECIES: serine hydrolase [Streptomyces]QRV28261.1 serine hydrolase [Streptomyces californicus]QRV41660.1 serine hydrolase [Streptomyces californicus]